MDISNLIRDPQKAAEAWESPVNSKTIIAKKDVKVYFPKHYMTGKLGFIDDKFNVIAMFGVVVEDRYFCATDAITHLPLTPETVNVVKIEDGEYYELTWSAGSVICPDRFVVKNKSLLSEVSSEFVEKGKTPWYMNLYLLANLYETDELFGGITIGEDRALISLTSAFRARHPSDRRRHYRHVVKDQKEFDTVRPIMTAVNSVAASTSNTLTKFGGGHIQEGMVGAIVEPSTRVGTVEGLLFTQGK